MGAFNSDTYTWDNGNIIFGYPYGQESFFGNRHDRYVYKFKSDYTQGVSSSASSSGSQYEYTFEIVKSSTGTILATMTVDLAGHDYHGYL